MAEPRTQEYLVGFLGISGMYTWTKKIYGHRFACYTTLILGYGNARIGQKMPEVPDCSITVTKGIQRLLL